MVSLDDITGIPRINISPTGLRTGQLIAIADIQRGDDRLCFCDLRIETSRGERMALIAVPAHSLRTWETFRHAATDDGLVLDPRKVPADWSATVFAAVQRGESRGGK